MPMTNSPSVKTLLVLREKARELARRNGSLIPHYAVFTCDACACAVKCSLAWDDYNTRGDCLALK